MDVKSNPYEQFGAWLTEAEQKSGMACPNAMQLATVGPDGRPGVRTLLLKGFSPEGFLFFTNYDSRKGAELAHNPYAALCFFWDRLFRQVRIEGMVEKISQEESQAYFQTRPRLSQISAWASPQSQEIPSGEFLETRVREVEERFDGVDPIPVPDFWGGYCLRADRIEFWQQGEFRLHERYLFEKQGQLWTRKRLAP